MRWRRCLIGLGAVALTVLGLSGQAMAKIGGVDRSFGQRGIVDLSEDFPPSGTSFPVKMELDSRGRIYLLASDRRPGATPASYLLTRFNPNGSRDYEFGTVPLGWADRGGDYLIAADFTIDGVDRPVVALRSTDPGVHSVEFVTVSRLLPSGSIDTSFGEGGKFKFPCEWRQGGILTDSKGRVLLTERVDGRESGVSWARAAVTRVTAAGALDTGFANGGVARVTFGNGESPHGFTVLRGDGIAFVIRGYLRGVVSLARFGSGGVYDGGFAARSRHTIASFERSDWLDYRQLMTLPGGGLDIFGNEDQHGYVMRFRGNGGVLRSFARFGLKRIRWPIRSVVQGDEDRVFGFGSVPGSEGSRAFWFSGRRNLMPRFGFGRGASLRNWPAYPGLGMQPSQRPVAFQPGDTGVRVYHPPTPLLIRFTPPGD